MNHWGVKEFIDQAVLDYSHRLHWNPGPDDLSMPSTDEYRQHLDARLQALKDQGVLLSDGSLNEQRLESFVEDSAKKLQKISEEVLAEVKKQPPAQGRQSVYRQNGRGQATDRWMEGMQESLRQSGEIGIDLALAFHAKPKAAPRFWEQPKRMYRGMLAGAGLAAVLQVLLVDHLKLQHAAIIFVSSLVAAIPGYFAQTEWDSWRQDLYDKKWSAQERKNRQLAAIEKMRVQLQRDALEMKGLKRVSEDLLEIVKTTAETLDPHSSGPKKQVSKVRIVVEPTPMERISSDAMAEIEAMAVEEQAGPCLKRVHWFLRGSSRP
ncbi:hypothetical protein WDW37_05410 [Bdellovibrionota bacterium FG-1]